MANVNVSHEITKFKDALKVLAESKDQIGVAQYRALRECKRDFGDLMRYVETGEEPKPRKSKKNGK